jgi:primosomal protein N' (replication factor Y)
MHASFSSVLVEKMNAALANGEQVILFQNRRGFSPYVECTMCGTIPSCHSCDVTLTYHKWHNSLVCHYCGYTQVLHSTCHACGSPTIETRGFGTEKIEDEVGILFPGRRVARMDLDSTRAKNAFSDLITRFENREIDILVGTQMVTKGLDFENVSLVGILSADGMLNLPDFRAFERSFQLMTQVAGRAGRSSRRGEVVIQTSSPDHHIVGNVVNHDFHSMVHTQLAERQQFGYPPFTRLIRLTVRHRAQATVDAAAEVLASILKRHMGNEILGPEYPPVGKIQDVFLKNILIKLSNIHALSTNKLFIIHAIDSLSSTPNFKSVEVVINVDPY